MIQGLLFLVYLVAMAFLISAVIEESISGIVILIFGIPITGAYLLIALIAYALEQNTNAKKNRIMSWSSECPECGSLNVGTEKQMASEINCGGCGTAHFPKELKQYDPR